MASSLKSKNQYHTRSISFPCKSHPSIQRTEDELKKLRTCEQASSAPTAKTICSSLSGLKTLHDCLVDLLNLPLTQQALAKAKHQHVKSIHHLLDGSLRLLDVTGITMDLISQTKQHVKDLQSALRRRKGDHSSIENCIAQYASFRRKIKKDTKILISALQQIDNEINIPEVVDFEDHFSAVLRILREVSISSISVFESVLSLLLVPSHKIKLISKCSLLSKIYQASEGRGGDNMNEMESVDSALSSLCKYGLKEAEQIQFALNRLENLEGHLEGIEDNLQCMFRCLIRSRTTLLNIISC